MGLLLLPMKLWKYGAVVVLFSLFSDLPPEPTVARMVPVPAANWPFAFVDATQSGLKLLTGMAVQLPLSASG
ncbi:hypothetical protein NIBR502770_02480 [Pseudarthrobacter sp. NIBRBAC000502770]|nr:hypothetical protein NIBR502770_02480 [Pseudarthrobacter sp. NIBRBAC000502770]